MSGADLSLLMPGGVSELPDDQLAEIMQQLTLEQQKRSQNRQVRLRTQGQRADQAGPGLPSPRRRAVDIPWTP